MNKVLKAYNDMANEVVTIEELEQKCKVLKLKVIKETHIEIIYKRFYLCALMGKDKNIHTLPFYVLDVGKIEGMVMWKTLCRLNMVYCDTEIT